MGYSIERRERIFDRTSGYCHICGGRLSFCNYGLFGARGVWEVEHSIPKCEGGTDHLNNLYAAHISCNRAKQATCTRKARAQYGRRKAPLSVTKRREAKDRNAMAGAAIGTIIGNAIAGPWGLLAGALIGAEKGHKGNPDD
jgi:5-methylcytosine-specific restriction endonuclease McrA